MFSLVSSDSRYLSSDFDHFCWGQVTPAICQVTRSNMSCFRWCQAISATCQVTLAFLVGVKWLQLRVKWLGQISHVFVGVKWLGQIIHVFVGVKWIYVPVKWLQLEIVQLSRAFRFQVIVAALEALMLGSSESRHLSSDSLKSVCRSFVRARCDWLHILFLRSVQIRLYVCSCVVFK